MKSPDPMKLSLKKLTSHFNLVAPSIYNCLHTFSAQMLRLLKVWHDFVSDVRRHVCTSDDVWIGLGHLHLDEQLIFDTVCWRLLEHVEKLLLEYQINQMLSVLF